MVDIQASLSKPITAVLILRLVEDGVLSMSDKVFGNAGVLSHMWTGAKPCCTVVDGRLEGVTVEHLLHHRGGWDRGTAGDPMFKSNTIVAALGKAGPASCRDTIYWMLGQPLQHTPGAQKEYSNFGYCILGEVIRFKLGAKTYEAAANALLLEAAAVDTREFFVGASQLKDMHDNETE